ncbi:MAG: hypothetical protein J5639_08145 [Bacteroidales bacterium]|nr:hypothetical protein [Bacteroidales bacterium]
MKKYFIIAAAALVAMSGCSKIENAPEAVQREISFEVANNLNTKATGVLYENGAFGTYAWFNNTDEFMVNEKVDKVGSVWKTVNNTYYWPKTGSISFISYSPFSGTNNNANSVPVITKNSITYTDVTVGSTDLMYANRATCSSNVNEVTDDDTADSGFSGVPTVFNHALAKLSFKIKANFVEYTDATTNSTTTWDVTVTSAKISGFKTKGNLELTLNSDGKTWDKPVTNIGTTTDPVNVNIWTNASGATSAQELIDATTYPTGVLLTTTAQDLAAASGFVLPQQLTSDTQKLELKIKIKTNLPNGRSIEESFNPVIDIKDISSLQAWQMNQNIVYTIKIKPTAKADGADGHDDDPNDVIITFDPAVSDWVTVDATATIQL